MKIKKQKFKNLNISKKYFEIFSYLAYDVVTTIKEIKETASEFPDITLCELDPLTKPDQSSYLTQSLALSFLQTLPMTDNKLNIEASKYVYSSLLHKRFIFG